MKRNDWLFAISLVIVGVSCLAMSATIIVNPSAVQAFLYNVLLICIWIGIPAFIATVLYLLWNRNKRGRK